MTPHDEQEAPIPHQTTRLQRLITRLLSDLPTRRDWLDPQLEAELREAVKATRPKDTKSAWTSKRPTKPGRYKWKQFPKTKQYVVEVRSGKRGLVVQWHSENVWLLIDDADGYWQPVEEPKL
jgi:hypothetical protein